MNLNTGQWAVIVVCAILILGYILGYLYNRQRAEQVFIWLRKGLSPLGEVSIGQKLPGMVTGGRLEVNQAAAPFKRLEVVYLLAPRENLIFWIFNLLQGKRDELIVWATYQTKPEQCVEVAHKGDRQYEKRLNDKGKSVLSITDENHGLQIAVEQKPDALLEGKVQSFLQHYPYSVIRLALRPEKPNLYLRIKLRFIQHANAAEFFSEVKELGG